MKNIKLVDFIYKISKWRRKRNVKVIWIWSLILFGPILTSITVAILQGVIGDISAGMVRGVILIDGIYLLLVISLVGYSVMRLFAARRAKSAGSRLHLRLSRVFAIVALIPTVLVAIFAVVTLSIGVEGWFSENVRNVVSSSLSAAEAYKDEQSNDLKTDLSFIAKKLSDYKRNNSFVSDSDVRIQLMNSQKLVRRGLKEAYIIDGNANLRSRGDLSYLFGYEKPSLKNMEFAENFEILVIEDWANN